jgi:tripartite-type tricarboxylate transporter receptor subunit TctC
MAQPYPTKQIRIIVPQPPGGSTDLLARPLAQRIGDSFGRIVVVDNRAGAGSTIGTALAAEAAPDGYTLLVVAASFTTNPSLYKNLSYDPARDFAPITMLTSIPSLLVVHPSLPVKTVKDLIALAKTKPSQLNFGSSGIAGGTHMSMELFKYETGIRIEHVPYKGGSSAVIGLVSGEVQLMLATIPTVLPYIKMGKLRALAVSTERRSSVVPEVPTIAESGAPGYEYASWIGLLAPAKTPQAIVARLNAEAIKAINSPEMKSMLAQDASEIVGNTPEQFASIIKTEIARWINVNKVARIRAD